MTGRHVFFKIRLRESSSLMIHRSTMNRFESLIYVSMPDTNFHIYKLKRWRGKKKENNKWNGVGDNRFDRFDSTDKLLGNGRDGGTERRVIHSKSER